MKGKAEAEDDNEAEDDDEDEDDDEAEDDDAADGCRPAPIACRLLFGRGY